MKCIQRVCLSFVFVLFVVLVASVSAQDMKIVVSAIGPEPGTSVILLKKTLNQTSSLAHKPPRNWKHSSTTYCSCVAWANYR